MHKVNARHILSSNNGMNIYRGCSHGCIYCDARSTCYQMNHEFEDIEVKQNAPELLEQSLRSKRSRCMIGTGAMSDPYNSVEKELMLTKKCLELINKYEYGVAIQTKSDLILRDLDLIDEINRKTKAVVQITITTYDDEMCKIVEPGVCATSRRFYVIEQIRKRGIPVIVWLTPLLPYINDNVENVTRILEQCGKLGVRGVLCFGMGLTLRDGDRQYYYKALDRYFPGLRNIYERKFGLSYVLSSDNESELYKCFYEICNRYNIETDADSIFKYLNEFEDKQAKQLSLFDY